MAQSTSLGWKMATVTLSILLKENIDMNFCLGMVSWHEEVDTAI